MNAVALVVFTYTDQWQRFLPLSLCSGNSNKIICFLLPKTKAYRSFFAKVIKSYKKVSHIEIYSFFQDWEFRY